MWRSLAQPYPPSLRGALATKQSSLPPRRGLDCFAALAMTENVAAPRAAPKAAGRDNPATGARPNGPRRPSPR
ncbi:hypothetical protein GTH44_08535 [Bradyrhizobium japonicum]|nr:hypothetical protein [Bradyrhizobium japonicum]